MKKKIAIINQRYGNEVNGGSEYYTKKLAEYLQKDYDVEVLTTTAVDYDTWKPYYPAGVQIVDGVRVRRFAVEKMRNIMWFKIVNKTVRTFPALWKLLEPIWIKAQGPYCPGLIEYIRNEKRNYDTFIFVTYLYYTTAVGLPEVAEKAILVPTAHDEYCIYFKTYQKIFTSPKGIIYLTDEEKQFVERLFDNGSISHRVAGAGVDIMEGIDDRTFREKYKIDSDYLIYVGRVDTSKKCDELFAFFSKFKENYPSDLKLVVVGKLMMDKPDHNDICCLGFVSEEVKYSAMAGAKVLIMPSEYESLSLVVLEAMAMGVPVVVNGACDVLVGHCEKSGAGVSYKDYNQFKKGLEGLIWNAIVYCKMQRAGKEYVNMNYNWDGTVKKYMEIIEG